MSWASQPRRPERGRNFHFQSFTPPKSVQSRNREREKSFRHREKLMTTLKIPTNMNSLWGHEWEKITRKFLILATFFFPFPPFSFAWSSFPPTWFSPCFCCEFWVEGGRRRRRQARSFSGGGQTQRGERARAKRSKWRNKNRVVNEGGREQKYTASEKGAHTEHTKAVNWTLLRLLVSLVLLYFPELEREAIASAVGSSKKQKGKWAQGGITEQEWNLLMISRDCGWFCSPFSLLWC